MGLRYSNWIWFGALAILYGDIAMADADQPYSGQTSRAIKALSGADIAGLQSGDGMGYAKAAELNGYPGPRHVLDNIAALGLSQHQQAEAQTFYEEMKARAVAVGVELIAREAELDRLFHSGTARDIDVARLAGEIGALEAQLRAAHLVAHIRMRSAMKAEQGARYSVLRGYVSTAGSHNAHGKH